MIWNIIMGEYRYLSLLLNELSKSLSCVAWNGLLLHLQILFIQLPTQNIIQSTLENTNFPNLIYRKVYVHFFILFFIHSQYHPNIFYYILRLKHSYLIWYKKNVWVLYKIWFIVGLLQQKMYLLTWLSCLSKKRL